jgi:hypothetical protein
MMNVGWIGREAGSTDGRANSGEQACYTKLGST